MEFRLLGYGPSSPSTDKLISCLVYHLEPSGHTLSAFSGILQPPVYGQGETSFLQRCVKTTLCLNGKLCYFSFCSSWWKCWDHRSAYRNTWLFLTPLYLSPAADSSADYMSVESRRGAVFEHSLLKHICLIYSSFLCSMGECGWEYLACSVCSFCVKWVCV